MGTDSTPLARTTIVIRPDLTLMLVCGETAVEAHLSPQEALDLCDALEDLAMAALVTHQLSTRPNDEKSNAKSN